MANGDNRKKFNSIFDEMETKYGGEKKSAGSSTKATVPSASTGPTKQENKQKGFNAIFSDMESKYGGKKTASTTMDISQFNSWYDGVKDIADKGYKYLSQEGWREADTSLVDDIDKYLSQAGDIGNFIRNNKGYIDNFDEVIQNYNHTVRYLNDLYSGVKSSNYTFSKFKSADEYNKAVEQAKRLYELTGGYDPSKNRAEGEAGWNEYVAEQERIAKNKKEKEEKEKNKPWWEKMLGYLGEVGQDTSLPVHTTQTVSQGYSDQEAKMQKPDERWTEEQRFTYGYLRKSSTSKAAEYAYAVNEMLNAYQEQEQIQEIQRWATDNFGAGAANTVAAILTAPLGLSDYMGDLIAQSTLGYIPEADGQITPFEYSQAVTGGISQHLNDAGGVLPEGVPIIGGKGWGDVYGLGTSIAQSSVAAYSGGSAQALISFFGSAAASGVDDALSRGATGEQAIIYGSSVGAAEALAEMIGIDNLLKIGSSETVKQLLINLLKQGGAEGLEEGLTSLLGNIADNIVMGDKSNFYLRVEAYMNAGLSEEEAKSKAWAAMRDDMLYDMLGGFASGSVHAGPQTAYQTHQTNKQYNVAGNAILGVDGGVDALKNLANQVAGVSDTKMQGILNKQSGKVSSETATGKGLVGKAVANMKNNTNAISVGRLYDTVQTANNLANASANRADIAKSLQRKGFNAETANDIATVLVAEYTGQKLSFAQRKLLESAMDTQVVKQVVADIMGNERSTMGQREANIRDFNAKIVDGVVSKAVANAQPTAAQPAEAPAATYEFSEEGVTTDKDGNAVNIVGVESTENGKLLLKTENGTIDSGDVVYASEADALVYEAVANMGATPASAWAMIKAATEDGGVSATEYATAAPLAYLYGKLGYEKGVFSNGKPRLSLTEKQSATIYQMGRSDADASVKTTSQVNTKATISEKNVDKEIIYEGFTYSKRKANPLQRASMEAIELINKVSSLEVHVYRSVKEGGNFYAVVDGKKRIAPNGYFMDGNKIFIDINAGKDGRGAMLFTMAHEIGHYIAEYNAADFKAISDFLFEHYGEDAPIYEELRKKKETLIESYKRDGKPVPEKAQLEKEAQEELVCDMLSRMLADQHAYDKLMELKKENLNAFQKLGEAIKKFLDKIAKFIGIYDSQVADFQMAASVETFGEEAFRQLQDLYIKAFVQADANFQAAQAQKNTTEDGGVKYEEKYLATDANADILEMISQVTDGEFISNSKVDLGVVPADVANTIFEITGINVQGFDMVIEARMVEHILKDHGKNGAADRSMEDPAHLARIQYVLFNADDIRDAGRTSAYAHFKKGKTRPAPTVLYEKAIGEKSYYVVQAVPDTKAKKLYVVSAFIGPKGYKKEASQLINAKGPDATAKTDSVVASKNSIREDGDIVNSESVEAVDVEMDAKTESVAPAILKSERTWTESDYVQERETAAKEIAKAVGVSVKKAKAYIDSVNGIAKMIAEDRVRLDYFSSPGMSSFVSNVEYGGSFDFSTLCKKRRLLTGTFTAIQRALPNTALTADEILTIRNRMKEAGLEVSCGLCYVEGSRANMGQFAKEFLKLYKQYYPDAWQPNMADVNTPDGIEWVRINHPECYEQYEYFWNHYGTLKSGDKNLFASQQKPKLYQLHTEYNGEILDKFNDDENVEEKNLNGGIRLQSFSDFEIVHLIDTMQIIMDMSRVGLAGQAYTKVPDFAWALGNTGLKINISLIAKDVDENGRLIFDDIEGMPIDQAVALRDRYSKNVGTFLVAFNDAQLLAAMADERVDYIIPFHRSQWKKSQYSAMGLPANTKDYTYMQNEKFIKPQYHEYRGRMVKDKATNYMPNEYWDFSKSGKENAEAYLEMCARNNKRPKFYKLLQNNGDGSYSLKADGSTDGYWKLLIDFKMYDNEGNGSPQMPVRPEFNMEEATRMLNDYSGGHSNFPVANGIVNEFVQEYKDSHKGAKFSDRDSEGNRLSKEQQEFFAESTARDENGNLYVLFHGSRSPLFTEFDVDEGVWLTLDQRYAEVYAEMWRTWRDESQGQTGLEKSVYADPDYRLYKMYANITNPLNIGEINDDFDRKQLNRLARLLGVPASQIKSLAYDEYGHETIAFVYQLTKQKEFIDIAREKGFDGFVATEKGRKTFCAFNAPNQVKLTTNEVPSSFNDIRYSDRDKVPAERRTFFQDRNSDSVSNRSLLANAFEGVAQNEVERSKIQEYRDKVALMDAEERKLTELNNQIKELSFSKGPRDAKKIRGLQLEARQTANRISTYDKQLLRLEASKPLQDVLAREKKAAYKRAEQKGKEALEAYREKALKEQKELTAKWQESRKKGIESRNKTAMRHKIKGVVNELNQYLLHGTKERHVPIELQKAVAEALDAVNMDTVGAEERVAKLEADLLKAKTPEQIQEISRKIDHIRAMGDRMNSRLQKLKDAYDHFVNSDDPLIANSHDEVISNKLQAVIDSVGDTALRDMDLTQLEDVYDMYRMVLTTIRNANKAFKAKKGESITAIATEVMSEVKKVGGKKQQSLAMLNGIKDFGWNNLKPVYAFEHIGSEHFTEVFNNVRAGEDVWAVDVTEARAFYMDKAKKHNYNAWDFSKRHRFESSSGMAFELDLEQIMSLYAYSKRDQAADHLRRGGIVFDESTKIVKKTKLGLSLEFNPTEATAYNISTETLADIVSKLTDEQRAFVDEMQEYLSTVMGEKGNAVSLEMYGVKLFKEKFYFPLKSAQQFMAKAKEQQKGEVKIKNSGFSKETVQKASNPIVLTPFMNVWADHVNEMSMYHAFVLPMEDFYRVYNFKTATSETEATESVEMFIQNAYGKGATKYIDQLLKDLNGGATADPRETFAKSMVARFKKAKVFASLSVVAQQPSAIGRAFALINPRYFRATKDGMNHDQLWNELKQYAPVAIIKEMGYFDTHMGKSTQEFILGKEYGSLREKMTALVKDSNYRDEVLSMAPALADEITWCAIWNAVKRETVSNHRDLRPGSVEFLKAAGERFTEVVTKTQVYDSVLARSANMRAKGGLMSMATSFMAEPTTSINMLVDAIHKAKRGYKGYAVRAFASVAVSVVINNALAALVYGARDDDEDETLAEKYVQAFLSNMMDDLNPLTYYPYLKDMWSLFQGYDVDRSDMSLVADLADGMKQLVKAYTSEDGDVAGAWWDVSGYIANIGGVPVENIRRDVNGAANFFKNAIKDVEGRPTTWGSMGDAIETAVRDSLPVVGWLPGDTKADKLYNAIISGDTAYVNRLKSGYKDQNAINTALRKALRENDPRIHEAAVAWNANDLDEYMRIAKEIIAEKHFVQDDVVMAIRSEANALSPDSASETAAKAKGLFTAEKFAEAISQGDFAVARAAKADIIAAEQKNGKTADEAEKAFINSARDNLKELYLGGKVSKDKVVNALTTYCSFAHDDAVSAVQYWDFKKAYPDVYADDTWIDEYYSEIKDSGISIKLFVDYRNKVKGITGENRKEKRMAVINSLPISSAQKDALYFAEGWTASRLYEAPWH